MAEKEGFEPSHRLPDLRPFQGRLFSRLSTSPKNKMAPQVGFEPTTDRLTADSSTTELLWNNIYQTSYIVIDIICNANKFL